MKYTKTQTKEILAKISNLDYGELIALLDKNYLIENYSFKNTILIFKQTNGQATIVRSYKEWQKQINPINNQPIKIKKGEKALKIFVPKIEKYIIDKNGKHKLIKNLNIEQKKLVIKQKTPIFSKTNYYLCGKVFDLSQTNAAAIDPLLLIESKNQTKGVELLKFLQEYLAELEINLVFSNLLGQKYGKAILRQNNFKTERIIYINANISDEEKVITIFHELSHHLLHLEQIRNNSNVCMHRIEVEAELITCLLAKKYRLNAQISNVYINYHFHKMTNKQQINEIVENCLIVVNKITNYLDQFLTIN